MDIKINLKLSRDSYNSNPGWVTLEGSDGIIKIQFDDRTIVVDGAELLKAVKIIQD